nr:MAG TPA: hypothetical protein [Caudoviricetes sp.]
MRTFICRCRVIFYIRMIYGKIKIQSNGLSVRFLAC